ADQRIVQHEAVMRADVHGNPPLAGHVADVAGVVDVPMRQQHGLGLEVALLALRLQPPQRVHARIDDDHGDRAVGRVAFHRMAGGDVAVGLERTGGEADDLHGTPIWEGSVTRCAGARILGRAVFRRTYYLPRIRPESVPDPTRMSLARTAPF